MIFERKEGEIHVPEIKSAILFAKIRQLSFLLLAGMTEILLCVGFSA